MRLEEFRHEPNIIKLNAVIESLCQTELLKKLVWSHLAHNRIKKVSKNNYNVKSTSGTKDYLVFYNRKKELWRCNCEGFVWHPYKKCSHILAVFCYKALKEKST